MKKPQTKYAIESDVSIPDQASVRKYPFARMAVGQSFAVTTTERSRVATAASRYGQRHGRAFTVRASRTTPGQVRCWRIA